MRATVKQVEAHERIDAIEKDIIEIKSQLKYRLEGVDARLKKLEAKMDYMMLGGLGSVIILFLQNFVK